MTIKKYRLVEVTVTRVNKILVEITPQGNDREDWIEAKCKVEQGMHRMDSNLAIRDLGYSTVEAEDYELLDSEAFD